MYPPGMPIPVIIYYRPKLALFPNNQCYDSSPWNVATFTGSLPSNVFTINGLMPGLYEWGYRIINPICTPEGNTMAISGITLDNTLNARPMEISEHPHYSFYPNPLNDKLFIDFTSPENIQEVRLRISDMTGKLLVNDLLIKGSGKLEYQTINWASGIYLYQIFEDGKLKTSGKLSK